MIFGNNDARAIALHNAFEMLLLILSEHWNQPHVSVLHCSYQIKDETQLCKQFNVNTEAFHSYQEEIRDHLGPRSETLRC